MSTSPCALNRHCAKLSRVNRRAGQVPLYGLRQKLPGRGGHARPERRPAGLHCRVPDIVDAMAPLTPPPMNKPNLPVGSGIASGFIPGGFIASAGGELTGGLFIDFFFSNGLTIGGYSTKTVVAGIGFYGSLGLQFGGFTSLDAFKGLPGVGKVDLGLLAEADEKGSLVCAPTCK